MNEENICRLCGVEDSDYIQIYNKDGVQNEVHDITSLYFHDGFLDLDKGNHLKAICLRCWDRIYQFHSYREFVLESQFEIIEKLHKHEISKSVNHNHKLPSPSPHEFNANENEGKSQEVQTNFMAASNKLTEEIEVYDISDEETYDISDEEAYISDESQRDLKSEDSRITPMSILPKPKTDDNHKNTTHEYNKVQLRPRVHKHIKEVNTPERELAEESPKVVTPMTILPYNKNQLRPRAHLQRKQKYTPERKLNEELPTTNRHIRKNKKRKIVHVDINKKRTPEESDAHISQWLPNLECVECHDTFLTFTLLKDHFREQHAGKEFYIICCYRKFAYRCLVEEHVNLHMDPEAYKCMKCGKSFSSRANLCSHRHVLCCPLDLPKNRPRKTNKAIDDTIAAWKPNLECYVCFETFDTFTLLRLHFRQRHKQKHFYVECCERKFAFRHLLEEHVRVHLDPDIFKCKKCKIIFYKQYDLNSHKCQQK
uniref:C2H2-type domain-containing protein n=2 Tax=Stomoxys calcitrans TaxID=35570 RepID=A0A1I8NTB4_STOCA